MTDYPPGSSITEGGIYVMGDNLFRDTGYRLKDSVVSMPYIAFNARQWQHSFLVTENFVMFRRTV